MLYGARECARVLLGEGLDRAFARHEAASRAIVARWTQPARASPPDVGTRAGIVTVGSVQID